MGLYNCTTCGNQHDSGLPVGAWVYWSGGIPVIVQRGERVVVEFANGIDQVWLVKPDGTRFCISQIYRVMGTTY